MKLVVALAFAVWAFVILSALVAGAGVTAPKEGTVSSVTVKGISGRQATQRAPMQP